MSVRNVKIIFPLSALANPICDVLNMIKPTTSEIITWFCQLQNKSTSTFLQFYVFILPTLLKVALILVKILTNINPLEIDLILSAMQTFISFDYKLWSRANLNINRNNDFFNITMDFPTPLRALT